MPSVSELEAKVSVEGVEASTAQLAAFGGAVNTAGAAQAGAARSGMSQEAALRSVSKGALLAGGALLGGFALGVGAAVSLEDALAPIGTLVGRNSEQFGELEGSLKSFIASSPKSADEIGASSYTILSAGISDTADAMDALAASEELSLAGLGTLPEATDLVTSAMNSFKAEQLSADEAARTFFGTIASGKTTTSELAQGFGQIAPLASSAGVSFNDLMAATAAITGTGQAASVVYSGLRGVISNIIKPTAEASEAAERLGIDFSQAHLAAVGLPAFLDELAAATGGNVEEMSQLFGSVEGLNAVLALTGPQADAFADNLTGIEAAGEDLSERADEMGETFSNRMAQIKNSLQVAIAEGVAPFLPAMEDAADAVKGGVEWFSQLPAPVQEAGTKLALFGGAALTAAGGIGLIAPKVAAGLDAVRGFGTFLGGGTFAGQMTKGGLAVAGFMIAAQVVGPKLTEMTGSAELSGAALGALAGLSFGPWGAAVGGVLGGVAGAFGLLGDASASERAKLEADIAAMEARVEALAAKVVEAQGQITDAMFTEGLKQHGVFRETIGVLAELGISWDEFFSTMTTLSPDAHLFEVAEAFNITTDEAGDLMVVMGDVWKEMGLGVTAGLELAQVQGDLATVQEISATAWRRANEELAGFDDELTVAHLNLAGLTDVYGGAVDAAVAHAQVVQTQTGDFEQSTAVIDLHKAALVEQLTANGLAADTALRLTDALFQQQGAARLSEKETQALKAATESLATDINTLFSETTVLTGSTDEATLATGGLIQSLVDTATQIHGNNLPAVIGYVAQLTGIPESEFTNVTNSAEIAGVVAEAYRTGKLDPLTGTWTSTVAADTNPARNSVQAWLDSLPKEVRIRVLADREDKTFGRQHGGPLEAGQVYRVGEAGEELAVFGASGYMLDHNEATALARDTLAAAAAFGSGERLSPGVGLSAPAALAVTAPGGGPTIMYLQIQVDVHGRVSTERELEDAMFDATAKAVNQLGLATTTLQR